jgi:hypothetical protein
MFSVKTNVCFGPITDIRSEQEVRENLPAHLGPRGANIKRDYALPTNGVGVRSYDVRLIHHVLADPTSPIRLRLCAHGADSDRAEIVLGVILIDIVVKCALRAAYRRLLVESIGSSCQPNASRRRCRRLSYTSRRNHGQPKGSQMRPGQVWEAPRKPVSKPANQNNH